LWKPEKVSNAVSTSEEWLRGTEGQIEIGDEA
jgi:hypothetical protein